MKKILILSVTALLIIAIGSSCKKSGPSQTANGNAPHALSDSFYVRGLLDTTWIYQGNAYKDECQISGGVCSSFLVYGPGSSLLSAQFNLIDSAHSAPKDTTILSWVGKTFTSKNDPTASHAYSFSFSYPDTLGRQLSSDYVLNNTGAKLTITSVTYDGLSTHTFDSITPYKSYRIVGTLSCKMTHLGDTVNHTFNQGVYAINVIEAK